MGEDFDVIVVGAGISGIGMGWHLQRKCPRLRYAILEARDRPGGTWDLFRYPGVRSDSDMHTLGYSFRPWTDGPAIADGQAILDYLDDTARSSGVGAHIRTGHRLLSAEWSTEAALWFLTVQRAGADAPETMTCRFLLMCTGYYDYARGHAPQWPGMEEYGGRLVHPQFWPQDLDYRGKRVVVIGSGATAVTLVPAMARDAGHVTMLQRSPTYVASVPQLDRMTAILRRVLPAGIAARLVRWRNILRQQVYFALMRRYPDRAREKLIDMVRDELGPNYPVDRDFRPRYDPWDQRLCAVPDGDLFDAIRRVRASVVTDTIARFTPGGILLASGRELGADIVVSATGLEMQYMGGVPICVDGVPVDPSKCYNYKGMMLSNVPNLVTCFGYTNASWTLRVDLVGDFVCRLLKRMRRRGMRQVTPRLDRPVGEEPLLDFSSGYVRRGLARFPRQGTRRPWKMSQNYLSDLFTLGLGGTRGLELSNPDK